jgi:NAD(P)-dependent dehydrogenase (short-subunit alcohol dehydrogenase family)
MRYRYFHSTAYSAHKAGADNMAADMAKELRPHGLTAWTQRTPRVQALAAKVAAAVGEDMIQAERLTQIGQFVGTLLFVSPKQHKGAPIDGRTPNKEARRCFFNNLGRKTQRNLGY